MTEFLLAHSPAHQASARALAAQASEMFEAIERLANPDGGRFVSTLSISWYSLVPLTLIHAHDSMSCDAELELPA